MERAPEGNRPTALRSGGAAMMPKENFWIGAKGGLLDRKHLDGMGEAVWLFLYFLLRQTQINDAGEGVVLYGNPLSRKSIAKDAGGWPERRIKDWTARLIKAGYIRAVRAGNDGMIFFVRKAKSKTKNPKPRTLYFPVQCEEVGRKNVRPVPKTPRFLNRMRISLLLLLLEVFLITTILRQQKPLPLFLSFQERRASRRRKPSGNWTKGGGSFLGKANRSRRATECSRATEQSADRGTSGRASEKCAGTKIFSDFFLSRCSLF